MAKKKRTKIAYDSFFKHAFFALLGALVVIIGANVLVPKSSTLPCANDKTCQSALTEQIDNSATGIFQGQTIIPPAITRSEDTTASVLGETADSGEKHIYIDLETQTMYAYQGITKVLESRISSGKWNPTPVGNFHIWTKLRSTRMSGGEGADYYNLPNVPYVMYFYRDYGLHGAYWHNNFGHKMSHGCVNLRQVDARDVYNWAEIGTPVSVCNSFSGPNSCVQEKPRQ